jgi:UDP-2,3-diacylglucosamine pyrophosphatase LpxH
MKALVISDLHFGAWTGDALLSRELALGRLAPYLDEVDELILLGDVFDFMFSTLENAFGEADSFFELVARKLRDKRLVFLAGNHDHHVVVRALRSAVEVKVATGTDGPELKRAFETEDCDFFRRFLARRLPQVDSEVVYPTYTFGRALLSHGHYLDAHMEGSLSNRLLTRAVWSLAGGRPEHTPDIEDYEAVIVPLTELLFTVAQMPRGTAAQQGFYNQLESLARVLRLTGVARQELRRLRELLVAQGRSLAAAWRGRGSAVDGDGRARSLLEELGGEERLRTFSVALQEAGVQLRQGVAERGESGIRNVTRSFSPNAPVPLALGAYAEVVRNLGWDRRSATFVFGHTHQPLHGDFAAATGPVRFWNTGSWVYEPALASRDAYVRYLERAWPGTAVLIDTSQPEPQLVEMLADQNPLHGGKPEPGLRRPFDHFTEQAARYEAKLRRSRAGSRRS